MVTFPLRVFQAALTGLQDLAFVARTQFAAWIAGTVLNVILVLQGFTLSALAAGWCVTQAIVIGACAVRLAWVFPGAMPRRVAFSEFRSAREYVTRSIWVSVSQIAQVLLNGTDVMIVGALLGPAAVVPYACTGKLVSVLANQPQAILQSAAPALSELRTTDDRGRLFQVSSALAQATLAVSGLVACVVLAVNAGFVRWWVGPEQFGGLTLTLLLLAAMIIRHFNTTNVYALFCFGHERRLALTGLADGVVTLVVSTLLVRSFGLAGAPLGAIAGVVLVSAPLNLAELSRETGVSRGHIIATLTPWAWRFAVVATDCRPDRRLDSARLFRVPGDPRRGCRPVLLARGRRSACFARPPVSTSGRCWRAPEASSMGSPPVDATACPRRRDGTLERYPGRASRSRAVRSRRRDHRRRRALLVRAGAPHGGSRADRAHLVRAARAERDGREPPRPGTPGALRARPAHQPRLH